MLSALFDAVAFVVAIILLVVSVMGMLYAPLWHMRIVFALTCASALLNAEIILRRWTGE